MLILRFLLISLLYHSLNRLRIGASSFSPSSVSIVAPVFCYEDSQNVILPVPSGNTYVPYKEVQGNEFFVTSQESLDMILALKDEFIQKYPMSEQP